MMDISKSCNYISLGDYEIQHRELKIVFSRYLKNMTNINYPLSLYEETFLSYERIKIHHNVRLKILVRARKTFIFFSEIKCYPYKVRETKYCNFTFIVETFID